MLNPYTLQPEQETYRPDSTMAIMIRNAETQKHIKKLEKSKARKEAFKRFFSRKK